MHDRLGSCTFGVIACKLRVVMYVNIESPHEQAGETKKSQRKQYLDEPSGWSGKTTMTRSCSPLSIAVDSRVKSASKIGFCTTSLLAIELHASYRQKWSLNRAGGKARERGKSK